MEVCVISQCCYYFPTGPARGFVMASLCARPGNCVPALVSAAALFYPALRSLVPRHEVPDARR